MGRTAYAVLSTENLIHNFNVIKQHVGKSKVIAMVKANAYGHGLRSVSLRLDPYVDAFGVASIDEAIALRKVNIQKKIILMEGLFEKSEVLLASVEKFDVVIHNEEQLNWCLNTDNPLSVWLKVDTGLGRLGVPIKDAEFYFSQLEKAKNIKKPIRIMSHFSCSGDKNHPLNFSQIEAFESLKKNIETEYSLCNSGAIFNFEDVYYDYVRPGLALYGISPVEGCSSKDLNLKPVMTLQSSLISIQNLKKGTPVGYGARYVCDEDMPVGIIAFGYGDGYPISAEDGTPIFVNGQRCSLIGRVSMDMMMVDLRNCPHANVGDTVILWGENLPIEDVVSHTHEITWSMITSIQNRVKFLWTKN